MNFTTNELAVLDSLDFSIDEMESLDAPYVHPLLQGFLHGFGVTAAAIGLITT